MAGSLACRRARPALAGDLGKRARRSAVDHHLHVMERRIGLPAGSTRSGLSMRCSEVSQRRMVRSSPPENATRVVDHDDLLVLRGAERHGVVEAERDLLRRAPLQRQARQQLAFVGVKQRIVPEQQMDPKLGPAAHQGAEEIGRACRQAVVRRAALADQPGPAVDVPAEHEDAALRLEERLPDRVEKRRAVDQHGGARRRVRRARHCGRAEGLQGSLPGLTRPDRFGLVAGNNRFVTTAWQHAGRRQFERNRASSSRFFSYSAKRSSPASAQASVSRCDNLSSNLLFFLLFPHRGCARRNTRWFSSSSRSSP